MACTLFFVATSLQYMQLILSFQELKECAGRVFVDSQPEFCLPEVLKFTLATHVSIYQ